MMEEIYIFILRMHLHSTMVLFKCYGNENALKIERFTFHYGSIQIGMAEALLIAEYGIYIPLWFYSNGRLAVSERKCKYTFTFHYGSIQIKK